MVIVGTNDLETGGRQYSARQLIMHEEYNQPLGSNDIGLIKIYGTFQFDEKTQPIKYSDKFVDADARDLQITGWGRLTVSKCKKMRTIFFLIIQICRFISDKWRTSNAFASATSECHSK